ncbi:MAG TPA: YihY/virulence factor BrkB family protein [Candidatus Acidoferrum sp.]|nr:YihY/virulence factor BrkB family protein [Candidatus Acidoferrum sp.]
MLKRTWQAFNEDKATRLAAAIAFSAIFSIAPLLIVLTAIVGWVLGLQSGGHGHHVAENALLDPIAKNAGPGTADTVRQLVAASFNKPREGFIAQIVGWVAFVVGATALFSTLQDALNAIWHVEATRGGWKQMLRDRLMAFVMIVIVGLLLLLTFVANAAIAFIGAHLLSQIPVVGSPAVLALIGQLVTFAIVTLVFAAIYKVLPDVKLGWRDVWFGAAVTALLFVVGEALIAFYLAHAGVASAYGAAGSLLVGLLWIYYSAIILLLGAEITKIAAGSAATVAPSNVRRLTEQPAGVDPRVAEETTKRT